MRSRKYTPGSTMAALAAGLSVLGALPALAHTPITTRYRFAEDVLPVLEKHCVRCHSKGGPTPMSLRTYREARPWAESIKEQLLDRNMPPLYVEHGSVRVENGSPLTARDLDVLVDWASGGAPEGAPRATGSKSGEPIEAPTAAGDTAPRATSAEPEAAWKVSEFRGFVSPADQDEMELRVTHRARVDTTVYVTGWSLESDPRWLRGAVLWIEGESSGEAERRPGTDVFLGSWVAGDGPFLFPRGAALEISPGSTVRIDARYKRTWLLRSRRLEPRTRLRLRLAARPAGRKVISVAVYPGTRARQKEDAAALESGAAALAFFPSAPGAGKLMLERAASPRVLLDLYRAAEEWPIMYRFTDAESLDGSLRWRPEGPSTETAVGGYSIHVTDP